MNTNNTYEAPEVFEIGNASEVTLGRADKPVDDGCDCTKDAAEESIEM